MLNHFLPRAGADFRMYWLTRAVFGILDRSQDAFGVMQAVLLARAGVARTFGLPRKIYRKVARQAPAMAAHWAGMTALTQIFLDPKPAEIVRRMVPSSLPAQPTLRWQS